MILLEGTRAEARAFAMMGLSSLRIPSCLSDVSSGPRLAPGLVGSWIGAKRIDGISAIAPLSEC
jgi:hypothetical protein